MPAEIIKMPRDQVQDLASDMSAQVLKGLKNSSSNGKQLPTMLLYDERGLRLYDNITTNAPEYYLFGAEEEILKGKADEIVAEMHQGTGGLFTNEVVLELGAGRRTYFLLYLAWSRKRTLGLSQSTTTRLTWKERELQRTLQEIAVSDVGKTLRGKVKTRGLCATYNQGLQYAESGGLQVPNGCASPFSRAPSMPFDFNSPRDASPMSGSSASDSSDTATSPPSTPGDVPPPMHLMFLGSSLGNFSRADGADFLRGGLQRHPGPNQEVHHERLEGAGKALGDETLFDEANWDYVNAATRPFSKLNAPTTVQVPSTGDELSFQEGEKVKIEESYKFSEAGLRTIQRWTDTSSRYSLWLLERPSFFFPLLSSPHACNKKGELVLKKSYSSSPFGVPSPQDWENLWAAWDCITRRMIPPSMLMQKPISLRHICLFYLGHIPTFLDIHLSRLLEEPHTEPEAFKPYLLDYSVESILMWMILPFATYVFVSNGSILLTALSCSSPTPRSPSQKKTGRASCTILQFQATLYDDMGRVLFMTFEHEAMHAETLLYMLLQRGGSGTLPPPGFAPPPWAALAESWNSAPLPASSTVTLGPATVTLGHDDNEAEDLTNADVGGHEFGWDNEHPKRTVDVDEFRIEWRPVTNGQFFKYYVSQKAGEVAIPASWVELDGEMHVRTLYGPVPMKIAQNWPVLTSYNSLSKYVSIQGGRLPTESELRIFLEKFESGYEGGANVGFRNWHPIPATTGGAGAGGMGNNGGVWEWTSTVFDKCVGFVPSTLYPGYSMDFFDGAHQVVLGGSYATIPRIAERRSVRNWYHRKYEYAWVSGRIAYDVQK
ncbi:DUF323 domain-containing protein [Mycena rebaudengoi]|nr:DUF323 domain-containing protein [Mycena rebaudengoi]